MMQTLFYYRYLLLSLAFCLLASPNFAQVKPPKDATNTPIAGIKSATETTQTIRLLGSATEFQRLHTGVQALSAKKVNTLKVGDEFCVDLQIAKAQQRWLAQISDVSIVKVLLDQAFLGSTVAEGMPNLHTWKMKAVKSGECEIVFLLPEEAGKQSGEEIVYKLVIK